MAEIWRIIDTGLRPAAQNIALNRALLESRRADEISSTLRFLRYVPSALIGSGQSPAQELNLEACHAAGIEIQRRLTGGDVMVLDEGQLAWELYLHRRDVGSADLRAISRRLCHAAAAALGALGVDARYRAHNDIEVDGRRIADSAVMLDGDALLFQGALLVDFDPGKLPLASRMGAAAPGPLRDRVASLEQVLGSKPDVARIRRNLVEAYESEFGVEFAEGDLTLSEHARYRPALREISHPDWISLMSRPAADLPVLHAQSPAAGGSLRIAVAYDRRSGAIRQAWFEPSVPVAQRRALADLESVLRDTPVDRLPGRIERFFAGRAKDMAPFGPADFVGAVQLALGQLLVDRV